MKEAGAARKTKIVASIVGILCLTIAACFGGGSSNESSSFNGAIQQSQYIEEDNNADSLAGVSELDESTSVPPNQGGGSAHQKPSTTNLYYVESVIDGDTIKVRYDGVLTPVRLIGVNTPETVDPRKDVECFGQEASQYLRQRLEGWEVRLESDSTQTDRDKYNRLLRYVYLGDEDINLAIISNGYGYEYTYNAPYQKQQAYKTAQSVASSQKRGLWADNVCVKTSELIPTTTPQQPTTNATCNIKGNISSSGERIYHLPGQQYYDKTKIDIGAGERWFCTEQEAINAGWRKSKR